MKPKLAGAFWGGWRTTIVCTCERPSTLFFVVVGCIGLREQAEKLGPPRSRSASPKGRGDKACRDFQKGNCSRGDKCPYSRKVDKPAAPAIKMAVTSTSLQKQKKSVSFSNAINTKTFVVPVRYGARWRTLKDPHQRHSNPRLCNTTFFEDPERVENVKVQTEAAIAAGELIHEVASRRRFKNKKAWAGPGMTWVVQYDKKNDCVTHDLIKSEFRSERSALASVPEDGSGDEGSRGGNHHEGHQWIMDTGCGSDLISKAKVEDHKLRRSKAKNPIQFQTANGNTKDMDVVTMNIVEFDESVEPYVLPDTPSVLSIGRRCMQEGYHFVWLSGKHPYLITPNGKLVALAVEDDIPYHISGDPRCQPVDPTHELSIPCLLEHLRDTIGEDQKRVRDQKNQIRIKKSKPGIKKQNKDQKNQNPVEMAKASRIGARGFKAEDQKKIKIMENCESPQMLQFAALAAFQELQMLQVAVFVAFQEPQEFRV